MKKFLRLMLIAMLVFSACGKDGKDGRDTVFVVRDFHVPSQTNNWQITNDDLMGSFFECRVLVEEITGDVFDNGAIICYLLQNVNYGASTSVVYTPLPFTFFGEDEGYLYSENYTFEVSPRYINFIVKVSDFDTGAQLPLDCTFRVVIMR